MTNFQRAELALLLRPIIAAKANQRQRLSGGRGQKGKQNSAYLKGRGQTRDELAKLAGVSHDTIDQRGRLRGRVLLPWVSAGVRCRFPRGLFVRSTIHAIKTTSPAQTTNSVTPRNW